MRKTTCGWTLALLFILTIGSPGRAAEKTAPSATHGLDVAAVDSSVEPGDDFFDYANGNWLKRTEIPADHAVWASFSIVAEQVNKRTVGLLREAAAADAAPGTETRKIGDFYTAFMDEGAIEKRGLAPVRDELDAIAAIGDKRDLARFFGGQMRADVDPLNLARYHTDHLFGLWVSSDFHNADRNAAYLLQGGLGMPDRDNYLQDDDQSKALQAKYREHIAAVFKLAGIADANSKAARIYDLEHAIASTHVSRTDSVDVHKADNRWAMGQFDQKAPGLDWREYFEAAGLTDQSSLMVWHPSAVTGIAHLIASEPLGVWKEYLTFHAIDRASPLLPKAFAGEHFAFYGTAVTGATEQQARWKRAVNATNAALGDAVGKLYVAKYFPPEAKAEAQAMVKNIVAAFGRRIDALDWMTPETKKKAKAKLATLYVGIGYPETWHDFAGLVVKPNDAYGNWQRSQNFKYRQALAKLDKPVDKHDWQMTPQTVNALNLPLQNALNFPAAILNPPFFDAQATRAENYGGIGAVIGHEISHSFDDQGSQFDAEGRLENWWTEADMKHFEAAGQRLVRQYNAYEPLPGQHINGQLTLSENIADLAGVTAAYDGYRASYGGKEGPAAQGFSGDQQFFLSFAQIWRVKYRPQALRGSLITNGHSPGPYRADTVRNVDAWYKAFGVEPGQKLYLPPGQRVQVW
jgi:putative endopeptidase